MDKTYQQGIYLSFAAAAISGFAVFVNKFGVGLWQNSSAYTTAKNIAAALLLLTAFIIFRNFRELKFLPQHVWVKLILIGIIGGSVPFLLFFKALTMIPASEAAFIHKTLFLWVALFSHPFLKEKLNKLQIVALVILLAGVYLFGAPARWSLGWGALLAFSATIIWSVENIIAKIVLRDTPSLTVALGRMFFGSLALLIYIALTGEISSVIPVSLPQTGWTVLVGAILFGYVFCWYAALKRAPAAVVTSILVVAAPITAILEGVVGRHTFPTQVAIPAILMIIGVLLISQILEHLLAALTRSAVRAYSQ